MKRQRGELIEEVVRQFGAQTQIFDERFEAAEPVRRLEQLTAQVRRAARHGQTLRVQRFHLSRQFGLRSRFDHVWQQVGRKVGQRLRGRERPARSALGVVVPQVVGAKLADVADANLVGQPSQVGEKVALFRRRLKLHVAHIESKAFRRIRERGQFLFPKGERLWETVGPLARERRADALA